MFLLLLSATLAATTDAALLGFDTQDSSPRMH